VNIISAAVGASEGADEAVMALTTDAAVPADVIDKIAAQDGFHLGSAVDL
jgi:hypothetical protein